MISTVRMIAYNEDNHHLITFLFAIELSMFYTCKSWSILIIVAFHIFYPILRTLWVAYVWQDPLSDPFIHSRTETESPSIKEVTRFESVPSIHDVLSTLSSEEDEQEGDERTIEKTTSNDKFEWFLRNALIVRNPLLFTQIVVWHNHRRVTLDYLPCSNNMIKIMHVLVYFQRLKKADRWMV